MKQTLLWSLILMPVAAAAQTWELLGADDAGRTYLDTSTLMRGDPGGTRFQLKLAYAKPRDMMGLRYDAASWRYALSCASRQVLWRQQQLLSGDEVVWTFPETRDATPAERELPEHVLRRVCG